MDRSDRRSKCDRSWEDMEKPFGAFEEDATEGSVPDLEKVNSAVKVEHME